MIRPCLLPVTVAALALLPAPPAFVEVRAESGVRLDGVNVVVAPDHPFGSDAAKASLANVRRLGARAIAVVPFLRQVTPGSQLLERGTDLTDEQLRQAIRDAHAVGLAILIKPQVLIPQSWAGAVAMTRAGDWKDWFANYRHELENLAKIAAEEGAEALVIGTELAGTETRPEWAELISAVRDLYSGRLFYMAHNVEEAESVPFWHRLDAIGVTLYPPLGADDDRDARRAIMGAVADRLSALATRSNKHVVVGEIGLRSAAGAAAKPWESVAERDSTPDPALQAAVIADWLAALDRPAIDGVLIWRWSTDPDADGLDSDFTIQNKPAEHVLMCAWKSECEAHHVDALSRRRSATARLP
jgi:hypothetical protein